MCFATLVFRSVTTTRLSFVIALLVSDSTLGDAIRRLLLPERHEVVAIPADRFAAELEAGLRPHLVISDGGNFTLLAPFVRMAEARFIVIDEPDGRATDGVTFLPPPVDLTQLLAIVRAP